MLNGSDVREQHFNQRFDLGPGEGGLGRPGQPCGSSLGLSPSSGPSLLKDSLSFPSHWPVPGAGRGITVGTAQVARAWALMAVDTSTPCFAIAVQIRSDVCVKAEQGDVNLTERGRVSTEHVLSMGGPISICSSGSLLFGWVPDQL